jgi:hypothetical protein
MVLKGLLVLPDLQVHQANQVQQDRMVLKGLLVLPDLQVHQANQVQQDRMVRRDQ